SLSPRLGLLGLQRRRAKNGGFLPRKASRRLYWFGNEVKTAAKRLAIRRNVSMRGLGVLLLAASGLINSLPIASQAQEQGAPAGVRPAPARNQGKAAARKGHRFWDRENDWLFAG